jgi:hypothetical protein
MLAGLVIVGACGSGGGTSTSSDGSLTKTIKVAGLGHLAQFADAATGAQARFKRFNDTNEMPGVKIKFTEFADDKGDPATVTSEPTAALRPRRRCGASGPMAALP